MKIALVHDDLVQWGGAERVLVALSDLFPDAPIYTSVYDQNNPLLKKHFQNKKIITSFLQKIPGWKSMYRTLMPLHPIAFEQFDFTGYDLVISQTTRFAKVIITKPETKHVCYCHTPPRFLWNYSGAKTYPILRKYFDFLRRYDRISSRRVDYWVAGSKNAQERIKSVYGSDSKVVYPFVDQERFAGVEPFDGGYLLIISRLNGYKRVDLGLKAAHKLGMPLKVVGTGPQMQHLQNNSFPEVEFLGSTDESTLTVLLAGCRALIISAEEDFGLTCLEAQALGKPVVAFGKGGALESVVDGITGYLFPEQTVESLTDTLQKLLKNGYNREKCLEQASRFSREVFSRNFLRTCEAMFARPCDLQRSKS